MSEATPIPAFDELPLVYQARIRDIQLELRDGEITQKGFDKRLAKIMGEYQANEPTQNKEHQPQGESNGAVSPKPPIEGPASPSPQPIVQARPGRGTGVGQRNGSKRSYYDARKSTVAGFRKPGINLEALLDDLEADDNDDEYYAGTPPLPAITIPESSSQRMVRPSTQEGPNFEFSFGSPIQNAPPVPRLPSSGRAPYRNVEAGTENDEDSRFDVEISSGRAYNALHDMMDPYGAQLSRTNQDLYSDDSSSNSILGDLDALGPTEFNPSIISNSAMNRSRAPSNPPLAANSVSPVTVSTATNDYAEYPLSTDGQSIGSDIRAGFRNGHGESVSTNGRHPQSQDFAVDSDYVFENGTGNADDANITSPIASMLTPETPTSANFVNTRFAAPSLEQDGSNNGFQQRTGPSTPVPHSSGATPISGVPPGIDDFGNTSPAYDERIRGLDRQYTARSSGTDNEATSPSADGTITLDDIARESSSKATRDRPIHADADDKSRSAPADGSRVQELPDSTPLSVRNASMSMDFSYAERLAGNFEDSVEVSDIASGSDYQNSSTRLHPSRSAPIAGSTNGQGHDTLSMPVTGSLPPNQHSIPGGQNRMSQEDSERYLRMIDASYIEDDGSYREYGRSGNNSQASSKPAKETQSKDDLDHTSVLDAMDYLYPHQEENRQQQQQQPASARPKRRLTLGTRAHRRPTNAGTPGIGRASYYAEEYELEIPTNFDIPDTPLLVTNSVPVSAGVSASASPSAFAMAPVLARSEPNSPRNGGNNPAFNNASAFSANESAGKMHFQAAHAVDYSIQGGVSPNLSSGMDIAPATSDPYMLGGGARPVQYGLEGSDALEKANTSMLNTAPLGRATSDGTALLPSSSNAHPTHDFVHHSAPPEDFSYSYGMQEPLQDTSASMQLTAAGQPQAPIAQQAPMSTGIGAIAYPRSLPDDVYSGKLKQLMTSHNSLPSILRFRASATPNEIAYTCIDTKGKEIGSWTWSGLHTRAIQVVQLLRQKGVSAWGDRVALVYRKYEMLDFVGSLYGCFYAGICAVPIVAGDSYAELVHVLNSTNAAIVLTTELNIKTLHKDIAQNNVGPGWPTAVSWVRTDNLGGAVLSAVGAQNPSSQFHARPVTDFVYNSQTDIKIDNISPDDLAYIEFSKSPNGELKGVQITHGAIMRQCATWMMSTGMLDIGRKYKHRVELEEDEDTGHTQDYSFGLADTGNDYDPQSSPSTATSHLEAPTVHNADNYNYSHSQNNAAAPTSPVAEKEKHGSHGSFGKMWGGSTGFLGKLRNVGSRSKIRRGSRARESVIGDSSIGNKLSLSSTRNSLASLHIGDGNSRMRAASNLSTLSQQSQRQQVQQNYKQPRGEGSSLPVTGSAQNGGYRRPSVVGKNYLNSIGDFGSGTGDKTTKTPSANVAVFKDVVVFHIEPRQHFGLVYGVFGGCYGGHQSVYVSSALCDMAGAYINLLTRYRATVAISDYTGLHSVLSVATDDPREIIDYSKKTPPNLARLRLCLIDTLYIDPVFHETFNKNVLHPFGCPYQGIADTEGHPVVTAVCTLAEHGSALMAMRDCLSGHPPVNVGVDGAVRYEFVLDREAFRQNRIALLPDKRNEAEIDEIGTVRYQSFGFPALNSTVAVVDPETRELCAADAIGELWMDSQSLGNGFWGLPKLSNSIFSARFTYKVDATVEAVSSSTYLRTGLMGAVVHGQILVFGFYEDRIRTLTVDPTLDASMGTPAWYLEPSLGFHYAGDINSTIRRYLPQISECTAFEMFANDTHFPVIAAEVRHNSGMYATIAEEVYGVLRNRNGLHAYAVALCPPDTLPRAYQYGKRTVNAQLCRHQFESGMVNCLYVKLSTDHLFMNLPPPASTLPEDSVGGGIEDPSVALYGRWIQQTSLEEGMPSIDEVSGMDLSGFSSITDILVWRASKHPDQTAFVQFDERARPLKPMTFQKLLTKVSGAAQLLLDKRRVVAGDHVLVAIAPSPSFVIAIHACLAIGAIPIPMSPPDLQRLGDDLPPLLVTAREMKVNYILVDQHSEETFRSKMMETALRVASMRSLLGAHRMPGVISLAKAPKSPKYVLGRGNFRFNPQWADPGRTALLMVFTGAQASTPQYVSYSHRSVLGFCSQQKGDFQMLPTLPVIASVRAYNGYGLLHCAVIGVYVGCTTLLLAPADFFAAPNAWFEIVQRYKVKDAFTTLPMLQHAMNFLSAYVGQYSFNLSSVRNFIVATEERVDPLAYMNIRDFFAPYYLDETSINPLYGTLMNPCISTRAYLGVNPLVLRLDMHAMRRGKVVALPPPGEMDAHVEGEIHDLTLQDSGKVSGSTMVAIVDPATRQALPAGSIGEVWVCSRSNASRKQTLVPGLAGASGNAGRPLMTVTHSVGGLEGDNANEFVRTGDLGFLYLQVSQGGDGGAPAEPYLFVAGKVNETFTIDGYMYFYSDIERAVEEACEDSAAGQCVVMQTTLQSSPSGADSSTLMAAAVEGAKLRLVAVVGLKQSPSESFLPNTACLVFNNVLDRHQVLLDEIVFVPRDVMPRSRISERRRRTVRGLYESGKLKAFVNFPVSNPVTLPSGLANPNNRQSFLGLPSITNNGLPLAQ
ncbi:hypothetical protein H4217_006680 [Coemansia sp. RSA 1939]|nr:hypothetical protein H4217_006680 [Coemansia sp. RSA 1939]